MPAGYFERNLALLRKHHPHVYESLQPSRPHAVGERCTSPGGKPNLKTTTPEGEILFLHDVEDPEFEVSQFLDMVPEDFSGFVALLGLGLGYTARALVKNRPDVSRFVFFDLQPGVFVQAMSALDMSALLTDSRVVLSIEKAPDVTAVLGPMSRLLSLETIKILKHLPSFHLEPLGYEQLHAEISSFTSMKNLVGNTGKAFGKQIVKNVIENTKCMHHQHLLEDVKGIFSGIPALLVAAGPSLDENIHLIPQARDKAIIISVDAAFSSLIKRACLPNFVTSIDYKMLTYEHISGMLTKPERVSLICSNAVTPKIPKRFPADHVLWMFGHDVLHQWMNWAVGGRTTLPNPVSVAHLSLIAAVYMGCTPIIFVGQDLAYPNDKGTHARDAVHNASDTTIEELHSSPGDVFSIQGTDGTPVRTSRSLHSQKILLEKVIISNPGYYINATEGGAHIEGTDIISLSLALNRHCKNYVNVKEKLNSCLSQISREHNEKFCTVLRSSIKSCQSLRKRINVTDSIQKMLRKNIISSRKESKPLYSFSSLPGPMKQKIEKMTKLQKKIDTAKLPKGVGIWDLLSLSTLEALKESEHIRHRLAELHGEPGRYVEWLDENLNRLDYINRTRKHVLLDFESMLSSILEFRKKEQGLLARNKGGEQNPEDTLELARLYISSREFMQARPLLEKYVELKGHTAETYLYFGELAANQRNNDEAETYFQKAEKLNNRNNNCVYDVRKRIADEYFDMANCRSTYFSTSIIRSRMLFDGLRYCNRHKKIKLSLNRLLNHDIIIMNARLEKNQTEKVLILSTSWIKTIDKNMDIKHCLDSEKIKKLYLYRGIGFEKKLKFEDALNHYQKALTYAANDSEVYIMMMKCCFEMSHFENGIEQLQKAVALNPSCAAYWEEIGDMLTRHGQIASALSCYEQCFSRLPKKTSVLIKIADCYSQLGNILAAQEAYKEAKKSI